MKNIYIPITFYILVSCCSCKKYLDAKSQSNLSTIASLKDLQLLLDNSILNSVTDNAGACGSSCDDYFYTQASLDSRRPDIRAMYLWQNDHVYPAGTSGVNDWQLEYGKIYTANTILENVDKFRSGPSEEVQANNIQGQGYCLRGFCLLEATWIWGKGYDKASSATDPGVVLQLSLDFAKNLPRSSVQACYDQVISDLKNAARLLPDQPGTVLPTRPGKAAAYAVLARCYLSMRDYANCLSYADSCLKIKNNITDYNTKDTSLTQPFGDAEEETIYYASSHYDYLVYTASNNIDTNLVSSYEDNDLRKSLFFLPNPRGYKLFKGYYTSNHTPQYGPCTDEVYLMRAECYARNGQVAEAMADLNLLLQNRYLTGTFVPLTAANKDEALALILQERRKELLGRGLRWMDLKRLNLEGANITLTRIANGQVYTLLPNSPRYAVPLPDDLMLLAGLAQNKYN